MCLPGRFLCVCDLIRSRATGTDAPDQSVTTIYLMTYSSGATSHGVRQKEQKGQAGSSYGEQRRSSASTMRIFAVVGAERGGGKKRGRKKKDKNEVVETSVTLCFCPRESCWNWLRFRERAVRLNLNSCRLYAQRHTRACEYTHTHTHAGALPLL